MKQYRDEMEKIIYEEFGDILREKDRIIEEKDRIIKERKRKLRILRNDEQRQEEIETIKKNIEYRRKIKQLNEMKDLNTSEARKIINSLMQL